MRFKIFLSIGLITILLNIIPCHAQVKTMMLGKKTHISTWIEKRFSRGQIPPFSFQLNGIPSKKFIKNWQWKREIIPSDNQDIIQRRYTYTDPKSGLEVRCDVRGFISFKAVDWVVHFHNKSAQNSGQINSVKIIDMDMEYPLDGELKIHYAEGNKISKADYAPREMTFKTGENLHIEPHGGRSSEEAFPFFNLESCSSKQGVMVAIGWTGTWQSDITKTSNRNLHLKSGMKTCDLYLYPQEQIRTPSVALLFWGGNRLDGHNAFRRLILTHHCRKIDGKPAKYPLCSGFNYRDPSPFGEYSATTADWAVAMINRYAQFEITPDVFWLDAGWHTGAGDFMHGKSWANTTGNWTIDAERFPSGMKPVSEAAHKVGAKFMLWFEPERVVKGTQWAIDHKEWMLDAPWDPSEEHASWFLFDLGNNEACDWLCRYYGDMIEENGIDYYRQDANIKPQLYWQTADSKGRQGMKEIRHIENLYKFWDYLLERFPNLLIDNCASGGKRLDWETIGRSAPLWRSDYYHHNDPDGYQCHTYGLNLFLPIHGTGILLTDPYSFRSSLSSTLIYNWKITDPGFNILEMQARLKEYREIRPYYYEDYYPLSGAGDLTKDDVWLAYQMHRPSDDSGIIVAFRRAKNTEDEYIVQLGGIHPEEQYMLINTDTQKEEVVSGDQLKRGYTLRLATPQSSLLIKYHRTK